MNEITMMLKKPYKDFLLNSLIKEPSNWQSDPD